MSTPQLRVASTLAGAHPAVRRRQVDQLLLSTLGGLLALALALAIAIGVPHPSLAITAALIAATLGTVALVVSTRYEITVTLVALYLGLLDGPAKLLTASQAASAARDVLIFAIALGMLVRLIVKRERVRLPALFGWVMLFVVVVLVQAVNPETTGFLKVIGGFRQQLEWVPFFFFGYLLMRSTGRFRKLFLLLGVIALANGLVGAYQSRLSPAQLASWGPGYGEKVKGTGGGGGLSGRTFVSEGIARPRPPALGSDSGFGGATGALALPGLLMLLAASRLRRRWVVVLLAAGAVLGVATSASRTNLIIAVLALVTYALLSLLAGCRVSRSLLALLAVVALAFPIATALVAADGQGVFARYSSVASPEAAATEGVSYKEKTLTQIPSDLVYAPLGVGLGTYGAAAGFGGKVPLTIEGQGVSGESEYNLVTLELGLPGLAVWVAFTVALIALVLRRLRLIEDPELRLCVVAVCASMITIAVKGFAGPTMATSPAGPFFWFAAGVIAYWLGGAVRDGRLVRGAATALASSSPALQS
jgi:O-antigen ligase